MKVWFFIRSMVVGGSQRQIAMLAKGLSRRGHDVAIAVFYTGGEIEDAGEQTTVRLIPLGKSGRWDAIVPLLHLRRLLQSERPDVLYAFQPTQTSLAALLLPSRAPTRLVFGIRAAGVERGRYDALSAATYRLEAHLSRRADLIVANSRAGRSDAIGRGIAGDRIAVIPNGIDTAAMRPDAEGGRRLRRKWGIPEDAFVVGCVARLDPMKDHVTLIEAAARFARECPRVRFVCVGDGPPARRQQLAALANSLGLADRLLWAGEMREMNAAYSAFDIATLPSAFGEGFPNVVGEAMACGVPVAATDVGDVRSIVGDLGEVVPPKQPHLLCAGWVRLRKRLEENAGLGDATRARITANYGVDAMIQRSEEIFAELVTGAPAADIARRFA
jgi:glycosyltransferase involved in cell wall biosynthesis